MNDIQLISSNNDKNNRDSLDEAYASLYKSLGVEPGLLSRTSIGKTIKGFIIWIQ